MLRTLEKENIELITQEELETSHRDLDEFEGEESLDRGANIKTKLETSLDIQSEQSEEGEEHEEDAKKPSLRIRAWGGSHSSATSSRYR